MQSLEISELNERGANAPLAYTLEEFLAGKTIGARRLDLKLNSNLILQVLMIVKDPSAPFIFQFHGALNRDKYAPPRFERLATAKELDCNFVFFADPSLNADERLQLAWYVGSETIDLHSVIAKAVREISKSYNVRRPILIGSSGGGFAALQVGGYVNDAIVVPINAQTVIPAYRVDGSDGAVRLFQRTVFPTFFGEENQFSDTWWHSIASKVSVPERYRLGLPIHVDIWQNTNDIHHVEHHFEPLVSVLKTWKTQSFEVHEYDGPHAHVIPDTETYKSAIRSAVERTKDR